MYQARRTGLYKSKHTSFKTQDRSKAHEILDHPEQHPAASLDVAHRLLEVYDSRIYPNCLSRTFSSQTYFDTAVGIIIRELNSPLGVPPGDFAILLCDMVFCAGCWCTFSVDAYNQHVQGGICSSHPTGGQGTCLFFFWPISELTFLFSVRRRELHDQEVPRPKGRSFPNGYRPPHTTETLDTPVGVAYLEWNSRFGVPLDVWVLISTAVVHCNACDLVRTHPAHAAHLDVRSGLCTDVGQGTSGGVVVDEED